MKKGDLDRRDFLRLVGYGALGMAAGTGVGSILAGCSSIADKTGRSATQTADGSTTGKVDLELELSAEPGEVQILSGKPAAIWHYQARLISGDSNALQPLPGSYLGPVIRVKKGQRVRVRLENRVDEPTSIHWHGLRVPPDIMNLRSRSLKGAST